MRGRMRLGLVMVLGLASSAACGDAAHSTLSEAAPGASSSGGSPGGADPGVPGEPPPEKELESSYEAPVATGRSAPSAITR